MKFFKIIFVIGCLSISVLGLCTLASYFIDKESNLDFKIGWPYTFYYQFPVNALDGYELLHGTNPLGFIYDCGLSFLFVLLILFSLKRTREYLISLFK
jgi:hypothetical protein